MSNAERIPRDLEAEAAIIGTDKEAAMRAKVAKLDPPSRAAAAVNLAIEGAGYSDIARLLDYPHAMAAKKAVWEAFGRLEQDPDTVDQKRDLMERGLGRLKASCMRRATNPNDPDHLAYVRVVLAIEDRRAKLWGLDAPTTSIVYSPSAREVDQYVDTVRNLVVVQAGDVEADVLQIEAGDGEVPGGDAAAS